MISSHISWRKSSYSTDEGNCVEVIAWRKASASSQEGNCVEVAVDEALVLARDSKDPDGPMLGFAPQIWRAFVGDVKSGRLDLS